MIPPLPVFNTGIATLNTLLGSEGFPQNSLVVIYGRPGLGKTTLSFQLATSILKSNKPTGKDQSKKKEYQCLFFTEDLNSDILLEEKKDFLGIAEKPNRLFFAGSASQVLNKLVEPSENLTVEKLFSSFENLNKEDPLLIVIDSLNSLCYHTNDPEPAKLLTPDYICHCLRHAIQNSSNSGRSICILLTVELADDSNKHRTSLHRLPSDVEILLTQEEVPLLVEAEEYPFAPPRLHYFCRVLKCRSSKNQIRRCAYDFVSGSGIVFYETFPGDGRISLFYENGPMRKEWEPFVARDIPDYYPTLAFDKFSREHLLRTSTSQRRQRHIPTRTSMYLTCFDAYWITLYADLCQRHDINAALLKELGKDKAVPGCTDLYNNDDNKDALSRITSCLHKELNDFWKYKDDSSEPSPKPSDADINNFSATVCKTCIKCTDCSEDIKKKLSKIIKKTIHNVDFSPSGILAPLDESSIRLFGERRTKVIKELQKPNPIEARPIYKPFGNPLSDKMLAVPYHANVGLWLVNGMVYERVIAKLIQQGVQEAITREYILLNPEGPPGKSIDDMEGVIAHRAKELSKGDFPKTWEEVLALCRCYRDHSGPGRVFPFLMETKTFDSYMATFLEIFWATGKRLDIKPDYTVNISQDKKGPIEFNEKEGAKDILFWAFKVLHVLFAMGYTPKNSSLDVHYLYRRATEFQKAGSQQASESLFSDVAPQPAHTWMFARHWYSTLIDTLTEDRDPNGNPIGKPLLGEEFLGTDLRIIPPPVSMSYLAEQSDKDEIEHHPCLGEWYFAVLEGTENKELAIDLINNLMSSEKVSERAFQCAAVPTTEAFYEKYGNSKCLNQPVISTRMRLPDISWNDFRKQYLSHARSRTAIFDYRHCMQELHAVMEHVRVSANPADVLTPSVKKDIGIHLSTALKCIQGFASAKGWFID